MNPKIKIIRSSWWEGYGYRLDCQPYLAGGLEALLILEKTNLHKDALGDLTEGFEGGIYFAGRDSVQWVESSEYGIPFLRGKDIARSDFSSVPFIAIRQVKHNPMFLVKYGMTLISRSGTIGTTVFVRNEMDGMASSDPLRVVPDPNKIRPGYLYAFLSSKFGIPLVTSGTYGAIIQHLEADDIAKIPVPRLDDSIERDIHNLVEKVARLRSESSELRSQAIQLIEQSINWKDLKKSLKSSSVPGAMLGRRLDSHFYSGRVEYCRRSLANSKKTTSIQDYVEEVFSPDIMARSKVDDPKYGVPFLSSSEVFRINPTPEYLISRTTPDLETFILSDRDVLVPRSGSLGGIIGRAVMLPGMYAGWAGTEHLIRVRCRSVEQAYYVWAILGSVPGYWSLIGTAFGSAIPSLDKDLIASLRIPICRDDVRKEIVSLVQRSLDRSDKAIELEKTAREKIESEIEKTID